MKNKGLVRYSFEEASKLSATFFEAAPEYKTKLFDRVARRIMETDGVRYGFLYLKKRPYTYEEALEVVTSFKSEYSNPSGWRYMEWFEWVDYKDALAFMCKLRSTLLSEDARPENVSISVNMLDDILRIIYTV